ncbi:MAG: hypothetical protein IKR11_04480 [Solobacterium sp.]|nr:hypothetical protein [Solobacterium sp.]
MLMACMHLLHGMPQKPAQITQARIVKVSDTYAILKADHISYLCYTDEILPLDAIVSVEGKITETEGRKGFYRFDERKWCKTIKVYYKIEEPFIHVVKENLTIRRLLQKRIEQYPEAVRNILYKTLLNISVGEDDNFLFSHGFSFTGILAVFDFVLKKSMDREKRKRILLFINILFCLIYHFPFMLVQSLIFRILGFLPIETKRRTGTGIVITMCLYPQMIPTISFLAPCVFRLSFLLGKQKRSWCFWIMMCLQSAFFHHINPVQCFIYPFLRILCGWLWFFSIAQLVLPFPFIHSFLLLNQLFAFHEKLVLHGSILGAGLPFYLLLVYLFRKHKHFMFITLITFFLFLLTGMFHPFGEISYINVGQGDSILIRYPFNLDNVMIDTGKPEQYKNIQTFLDAKGIYRIHTLVITHDDLDHSGNKENVYHDYHVRQLITSHQNSFQSRFFQFVDLNEINNEDTNESSIVLYTQINRKKFLFMADADQITEETMIEKYGNLNCDVLKLSHHGSKTGSCDRFLDTVKPGIAIVSSGAYAIYHHPSPVVIQRLLKRHIPYFDTKEEGDISIFFLPGFCVLLTSSGRIGFF